jgi:pimeloyl-ACP methyl ester carboxylesterase
MDLAARIRLLEEATQGTVSVLAGSSYGGLAALVVAARHSARFSGLLLLAPALHLCEPPVHDPTAIAVPQGLRAVILHGRRDDVVPIEVSRRLAERSKGNVTLHEVDDDHRLADSLDLMVTAAEELLRP